MTDKTSLHCCPVALMDPAAVREAAGCMKQDASGVMTGYALALPLPNEFAKQLEKSNAPHAVRLGVLESSRGMPVLCVVCQVGNAQVRVVAAANDAATREWLRWLVQEGRFQLFIEIEETQQVVWVSHHFELENPGLLMKLAGMPVTLDAETVKDEIVKVASQVSDQSIQEFIIQECPFELLAMGLLVPEVRKSKSRGQRSAATVH